MNVRPLSCTILDTRFLLEAIPEETASGLSLLLQGFRELAPNSHQFLRQVQVSVTATPSPGPDHSEWTPNSPWVMELRGPGEWTVRIPLPGSFPDPREVELALIRQAMELSGDILVLHAAALAREGESLLVVGESGTGKTTLSLLLRTRGWTLLSDDLAPFHIDDSRLLPFPRALHVDGEYPPEAVHGLFHPSRDFPPDYAPFPVPTDPPLVLAGAADLPKCLLYLTPRADRGPGHEVGERGHGRGVNHPAKSEIHPLPGAEVAQILHRSVIRSRSLEVDRALPFLIELGKGMRGFRVGGGSPGATLQNALKALDLVPRHQGRSSSGVLPTHDLF